MAETLGILSEGKKKTSILQLKQKKNKNKPKTLTKANKRKNGKKGGIKKQNLTFLHHSRCIMYLYTCNNVPMRIHPCSTTVTLMEKNTHFHKAHVHGSKNRKERAEMETLTQMAS